MRKIYILCIFIIFLTSINHSIISKQNKIIIKNQSKIEKLLIEEKQIEKKQTPSQIKEKNQTLYNVKVTAYAPLDNKSGICADNNPTITATGTYPTLGVCAVNPAKIPYGSLLYIPGYGYAIAQDTGAAIRNYSGIAIDVVMETYEDAIKWGVRYLDIQILDS